jgi:hypothetical protein
MNLESFGVDGNVQHTTSNMENNSATGPTLLRQIPLHCCAVETVAAAVREGRRMPQTRRCRLHLPIVLGGLVLFALVAVRYLWLKLRRTL